MFDTFILYWYFILITGGIGVIAMYYSTLLLKNEKYKQYIEEIFKDYEIQYLQFLRWIK